MRSLESRLSKLESAVGIGLSSQEQFSRLLDSQSDEVLLKVLTYIRARIKGTEPPDTPTEVVRLTERLLELMAAAN